MFKDNQPPNGMLFRFWNPCSIAFGPLHCVACSQRASAVAEFNNICVVQYDSSKYESRKAIAEQQVCKQESTSHKRLALCWNSIPQSCCRLLQYCLRAPPFCSSLVFGKPWRWQTSAVQDDTIHVDACSRNKYGPRGSKEGNYIKETIGKHSRPKIDCVRCAFMCLVRTGTARTPSNG